MRERFITDKGRANAANLARILNLGRTMVLIQDGASAENVKEEVNKEFLALHESCPCCKGGSWVAKAWAEQIYHTMFEEHDLSS